MGYDDLPRLDRRSIFAREFALAGVANDRGDHAAGRRSFALTPRIPSGKFLSRF
jgi:hypothetical protein